MLRLAAVLVAAAVGAPLVADAQAQPATWNFAQIRIGRAQAAGRYGAGVTVAVLDTWIDRTHPDFGGRVLTGADCVGGTCKRGNVPPDRCEAHGTHVAGTVASRTYGVAPAARILPIRILRWDGAECTGTSRDLAAAVRYATANGARVVNISAGAAVPLAGSDTRLDAAVADAANKGVLVVFAAGNSGLSVSDSYGGNALIVAATSRGGRLASYSQRGSGVDLAAPGGAASGDTCTQSGCVVSTWSDGTRHQYAALAGTSMAAPHVSGVAALLFAQRTRSRNQVVARLRDTARPLAEAGDGLVDASAALAVSSSPPATASSPAATPSVIPLRPRPKPQARPTATPTPKPTPKPTRTPTPTPAPVTTPPAPSATPPVGAPADPSRDSRGAPIGVAVAMLLAAAAGTAAQLRRPRSR
ncbi:MAG TPA: S8 family serine peptidase [Frankiaceae bacterium]|nr:S8 family serine peptidase [Frankiaceae bacterium]